MTLAIKIVGKTIRELIESKRTPTTITPKLDPTLIKKILKKEKEKIIKYKDTHGVEFYVGSKYYNYRVDNIIVCTYSKFGRNEKLLLNAVVGSNFPVYQDKIIKSNGNLTALNWNKFENKYKFELVKKEKILTDEVMGTLIYNTDKEYTIIKANHKRLETRFYNGVILETVRHVKNEKLITIIEDQENVVTALNVNRHWSKSKDINTNLGIYYVNDILNIVVWKYDGQWIITSNSSYLRVRKYLSEK